MTTLILKALVSRLAGPIATTVALLLLMFVGVQSARLAVAERGLRNAAVATGNLNRELVRCQGNQKSLVASISKQNAEIEELARVQSERLARAEKAAQAAAKGRLHAELRAAALLKVQPQGADACSRFMAADRAVLDSLH